jgi:hypothetical protein
MSTFDQASLVMIPSGYKASKVYSIKPTDGSGDLTFSRSNDTATRVNSAGLIEKVRTNQYFKSTQMAASTLYVTYIVSPTSLGTYPVYSDSLAYSIVAVASNQGFAISLPSSSSIRVVSFFSKDFGGASAESFYYSGTGAQITGYATTEIINGYTRYYVPIPASTSGILYCRPNNNTGGTFFITAPQIENGDYPTAYISNDTTASVITVGPVANVPRLDYLNSSCPRLLLEPQRTNVMLYSEQLNNAAWDNPNQVTITANAGISPDGYANADRVLSTGSTWFLAQQKELTNGTTYVLSMYVKSNTSSNQTFRLVANGSVVSSNFTATTSWQRFTLQFTGDTGLLSHGIVRDSNNSSADLLVWGAQLEAGAYATSYIPTLGASVTRGADTASKTGVSSLVGGTEGTLYVEGFQNVPSTCVPFQLSDGTNNNRVQIEISSVGAPLCVVSSGGSTQAVIVGSSMAVGTTRKIAITFKANEFKLYQNGQLIGTDTSGSIPVALSAIYFGSESGSVYTGFTYNQVLDFKTALTEAEAIALTTL